MVKLHSITQGYRRSESSTGRNERFGSGRSGRGCLDLSEQHVQPGDVSLGDGDWALGSLGWVQE